jgi:hypothetical protein
MTDPSVHIQISSEEVPSVPCWFGEVAIVAHSFTTSGLLATIAHQVRLARARFGTYEVLDFVVVLLGYAISGEPTLLAFYERLTPFAVPFMALFNCQRLPHRILKGFSSTSLLSKKAHFFTPPLPFPTSLRNLWDPRLGSFPKTWLTLDPSRRSAGLSFKRRARTIVHTPAA